ncbi:7532_t:CDS:2, partial [Dentiscutata erythropus]
AFHKKIVAVSVYTSLSIPESRSIYDKLNNKNIEGYVWVNIVAIPGLGDRRKKTIKKLKKIHSFLCSNWFTAILLSKDVLGSFFLFRISSPSYSSPSFLKIDKVHFEPVGSEPNSIRYCKKTYNKCSIHNQKEVEHNIERFSEYEFIKNTISTSNKKRLTNCQCGYEDLNDFSECKWCTLECCSQQNKKVQNKREKNQSQDQLLKDAQECMDDIL